MANAYYTHSSAAPPAISRGASSNMRAEFDAIVVGFDRAYADIQAIAAATGASTTIVEASVASAATTPIGSQSSQDILITGSNSISSFGTTYSGIKFIRFASALSLVNGSSLVLPGGANITTVAGDTCIAIPIGNPATGWRIADYRRMSQPLIDDDALRLAAAASTYLSQSSAASTYSTITATQNGTATILGTVAGTNTITANATPAITGYVAGQTFRFTSAGANTGAVTININGQGAKAITKSGSTALGSGDIPSGAVVQITYDGTQFQLVSGAGGGAVAGGVMYENSTTLTSNYTLTAGKNASTVGPLTVATGITLTVPSGQRLVIL
jgi:hypothetical protein